MSDYDSPFTSKDLTVSPGTQVDGHIRPSKSSTYKGQERRHHSRRKTKDRRSEVRFETGKTDRRDNHGRRNEDGIALLRDPGA